MTVEELCKIDNSFNSSMFISRANNMIKKLYNSTTLDELDTVDHFASDEVFNKFKKKLEIAKNNNMKLIYDQVNVSTEIKDISMTEEAINISCNSTCSYCEYYIDNNGKIVSGSNTERKRVIHQVVFQKKFGARRTEVLRCLGCGTTFNFNENGICPTCGRVFDLEEYDYYLYMFV